MQSLSLPPLLFSCPAISSLQPRRNQTKPFPCLSQPFPNSCGACQPAVCSIIAYPRGFDVSPERCRALTQSCGWCLSNPCVQRGEQLLPEQAKLLRSLLQGLQTPPSTLILKAQARMSRELGSKCCLIPLSESLCHLWLLLWLCCCSA